MKLKNIKNNEFKIDNDNNDVVLNSLNIGLKSYFSSYKSIRENFDKRTYSYSHKQDYYENFSETILHFHHFFELILKDLLRKEEELLPLDITCDSYKITELIKKIPLSNDERMEFIQEITSSKKKKKNFNTLTFYKLLNRTCKVIELKPEVKFKFLAKHRSEFDYLNYLRNKIWHQGKVMLKYEAFDFLIGQYILPLVKECLEVSEYKEKYRSHKIWRFNKNSLEINPFEDIIEEFKNESPAIDKIAVLKELGRASYYSHYGKGFGSIIDSRNQSANQLAQAELENSLSTNEILKCPCCAANSLVTYTHTEITDIEEVEYEDENGNHRIEEFKDYYEYIYKVKCANCGFQLNDKGIKNLKEYEFDVEDYWKNINHY
ncbi:MULTISPECIES: hypothetical protein [Staphylococcus]|uniref:hypothetical protein n=1 Tax=Staphylococcus TaxID=1279 RepID=UPI002553F6EE|nr:hypothetical protein [Staphylococcus equorum]MDK9856023.1 hypothetical protein [Staphylococcus equorum]